MDKIAKFFTTPFSRNSQKRLELKGNRTKYRNTVKFRKYAPQTRNAPLNRPTKYKPPGGLYLENCPQIQSKTKKKR